MDLYTFFFGGRSSSSCDDRASSIAEVVILSLGIIYFGKVIGAWKCRSIGDCKLIILFGEIRLVWKSVFLIVP